MKKSSKVILLIVIILVPIIGTFLWATPNFLKKGVSGGLLTDTTWGPGTVYVSGDVVVLPWVTLTILPGTTIKIVADSSDFSIDSADKNPDDWNTGDPTVDANAGGKEYVRTHNSIIGLGKIICKGTAEEPIRIISAAENPSYTDWVGIYLGDGEFEYTEIAHCLYGLYAEVEFDRLTVDHCYIHDNFATGVGFFNPSDYNTVQAWIKHSTIVDCGHEAIDTHSVGNLELAYNYISTSQVGLNLRDDYVDVEGHFLNVNAHHNIVVNCNKPALIAGQANVFMTQMILQSYQIDSSRWFYDDFVMHQMENPCAIFTESGANFDFVFTNSIILDSVKGIWSDGLNDDAVIQTGFLNFDNVTTSYAEGISPGANELALTSGFVNKDIGDYHLATNSPLIGQGNPDDGNPDLGAYGGSNAEDVIGWMPTS